MSSSRLSLQPQERLALQARLDDYKKKLATVSPSDAGTIGRYQGAIAELVYVLEGRLTADASELKKEQLRQGAFE